MRNVGGVLINGRNRFRINHLGVGQHGWACRSFISNKIIADNDSGDSSRTEILSARGINEAVLANIHGTRHQCGGKVTNEGRRANGKLRVLDKLQSVEGLVGANVDVG